MRDNPSGKICFEDYIRLKLEKASLCCGLDMNQNLPVMKGHGLD